MNNYRLAALTALGLFASQALADDVLTDNNGIVRDFLCVGFSCNNPESYLGNTDILRLKSTNTAIYFDDTSTTPGLPDNDWRIVANEQFGGGADYLAFADFTGGNIPFKVMAGAPDNALVVSGNGNIGIGTILPLTNIHIVNPGVPSIRLEDSGATASRTWDIVGQNGAFYVWDRTSDTVPLLVDGSAPTYSFIVQENGDVGFGTQSPEGKMHTRGPGVQLAYFESSDGNAVQVRFRTDSENRRFLAVNNANEVKSQIVFGDDEITFLGQTVANEWLRISNAGIVSSGPTCNPNPCDATFDPEVFAVPPIAERAAYMWENMHLPAVGPTAPGEPFNVTEKMGGVIHELEVAHIYIEQLYDEIGTLKAQVAEADALKSEVKAQAARLAAIEAKLIE